MLDRILLLWFIATGVSLAIVAWDTWRREMVSSAMQRSWLLLTFFAGPLGLAMYLIVEAEPCAPGAVPFWKRTIDATVHCVASDATGIALGGAAATLINWPTWAGFVSQYVVGLAFGLVFFPMWFTPTARGVDLAQQVRASFLPRWFSMNAMMAGMIPLMMWFMRRDGATMDARSLHFWAVMFLTIMVGGLVAYPVNWWLVAHGLHPPVEDGCGCVPAPTSMAGQERVAAAVAARRVRVKGVVG